MPVHVLTQKESGFVSVFVRLRDGGEKVNPQLMQRDVSEKVQVKV